jgi:hypothetical protein
MFIAQQVFGGKTKNNNRSLAGKQRTIKGIWRESKEQ